LFLSREQTIPVAGCRNLNRDCLLFEQLSRKLRERERERVLGEIVYSVFIISAEKLAVNLYAMAVAPHERKGARRQ